MAPPKQSTGQRKSSSSLSKTSTNPSADKSSKPAKPTKIIHLQLPKSSLLRFPHDPIAQKSVPKKKSPLSISTTAPPRDPTPTPESNETPVPPPTVPKVEVAPSEEPIKKESTSPKTGSKRELGTGVEEPVKQKGKPGPKKKPRL